MYSESKNSSPDFGQFTPTSGSFDYETQGSQEKEAPLELEKIDLTPEQENKYAELREIMNNAIYKQPDEDLMIRNHEELAKFAQENPDFYGYGLAHLIIGSGLKKGDKLPFDSDDHKIEKFVRSLQQKKNPS